MKNYAIIAVISLLCFTACKSKEEKATELIKMELSKTLYDFGSYEPIETTITEAYNTVYNDSACFIKAMAVAYGAEQVSSALNQAKNASDNMAILGAPRYYSSEYSDHQYYKYKSEREDKLRVARTSLLLMKIISQSLEDTIPDFDGKKIIGWEVKHKFRCKTRGGIASIGDYRYIISSDFKNVLLQEDLDNRNCKTAHEILDYAVKGELTKTQDINF
jgi:hypothetical protein